MGTSAFRKRGALTERLVEGFGLFGGIGHDFVDTVSEVAGEFSGVDRFRNPLLKWRLF